MLLLWTTYIYYNLKFNWKTRTKIVNFILITAEIYDDRKVNRMPKLNLLNEKYGMLTVIAEAPNINGRTAWLCKCDCGNEI